MASASGETASEAPSNASRAAWSLRDLTEKGYGATDAALALLASDWDLNAAAALLERHLSLGGVEASVAPALHARLTVAVGLVLGRSVGYVRQRWHEHQINP